MSMQKMDNAPNIPLDNLRDSFSLRISEQLKLLLEKKHLYQNTQLEWKDLLKEHAKGTEEIEQEFRVVALQTIEEETMQHEEEHSSK